MSELDRDHGWASWLVGSRAARPLGVAIACGAGTGAVVTATVVAATLINGRPVAGLTPLVVPAVVMLAIGQLWMLALQQAGDRPRANRRRWLAVADPRTLFGGELPPVVAIVIGTVALAGFLAGIAAAFTLRDGAFDGQDLATEQRLWAGVFTFFFAVSAGAALGGLRRPG